jgi:hypothetical protein
VPQTYTVGARSMFVTVTAWVFIVLSLAATVFAVIQNAAVASLLPGSMVESLQAHPLPLLTRLLVAYMPWVVGAGLALSLATLASAVGLLLRFEWARRAFIGVLGLAIIANLLGLWLQREVVQSLVDATLHGSALPAQAAGVFGGFVTAAKMMAVVMTLTACGLLGWIIRRLMSPMVRQEFA